MKVAMITSVPFPPECGIGNYVYALSNELIKRGHGVVIVTRGGLGRQIQEYGKSIELDLDPPITIGSIIPTMRLLEDLKKNKSTYVSA